MARRRKKQKGMNLFQKFSVVLTGVVLALCVASVTYGFFIRHTGDRGVPGSFRVEVWNGTGEKGLAQEAARALMKRGVDVFKVGNADNFAYDESIIITRRKNAETELLARMLGCTNIVEQLKDDSIVDATFVIGADYQKLKLGLEPGSPLLE